MFFGYPLVQNVVMSFQNYTTSTFFIGIAPWVGFANYKKLADDPVFTEVNVGSYRSGHGGRPQIGRSSAALRTKRRQVFGPRASAISSVFASAQSCSSRPWADPRATNFW